MLQFEKLFRLVPAATCFLLLLLPSLLFSQATTLGNILGTATDPSGATVPNAEVQVINIGTGVARQTTTDGSGTFAVRSLIPGVYRIEVTAPSFQKQVQDNIRLDVAATVNLDFHLTVGQVTETVQVQAEAPMLQTTEGTVSTVIENAQVVELPLNGRNFNNLVRLTPGASRGANSGGNTLNAQTWSVTGSRSDTNYYSLDGMFNNGTFFKTAAIAPSIDSIQEFKIQTNMSARYGAAAGANINVVTKSGTNQLHGTLYEFFRHQKLDSRDYFARSRPHFRHNQFGGSAGGPIVMPRVYDGRNRSFWFFNYEGFRERRGVTQVITVPTPAMLTGDLSRTISGVAAPAIYDPLTTRPNPSGSGFIRDRFPNNQIPASRIKPYATAYANLWFPTNLIPGVNAGNFINDALRTRDDNQITARIDQKITDNNNIFGRFTWQDLQQLSPVTMPTAFQETYNKYVGVSITDSHVFNPTTILELRGGYLRANLGQGPTGSFIETYRQAGLTNTPLNFRQWDYPINFGIAGFSGPGLGNLVTGPDFTYQASATLTKIWGKHTVYAGYDYTRLRAIADSVFSTFNHDAIPTADPQNIQGTGSSVASFLLGLPSTANRIVGQTDLDIRHDLHHAFIQDDIRLTSNFTFNVGLRYEYNQWPHHIRGRMGGFDTLTGQFYWTSTNPITGEPPNVRPEIADPDFNNFAPRVGFSWRILPRTTLRSAYGIFYNANFSWEWSTGRGNWPYSVSDNLTGLNIAGSPLQFSDQLFQSFDPAQVTPAAQHTIARDLNTPYMQNWNFGIEHQLAEDLVVELNYQGAKGTHLPSFISTNDPPPGPGDPNPRRPFPIAGSFSELKNFATSRYNGLTAKVEKRFSRGFSLLGSYAWQKSIDLNSQFGGSSPQDIRNISNDLGPSDFDQTHVSNISYVWQLPFGNDWAALPRALFAGWQTTGILTLETGRPFNLVLPFDNANVGSRGNFQRPNLVGDPFPSGWEKTYGPAGLYFDPAAFAAPPQYTFGNLGRNALRGPGFVNLDFGLYKNFNFAERYRLQIRGEAFNLLNNSNFGTPGGSFDTPGFGRITGMSGLQRQIQLGAKIYF